MKKYLRIVIPVIVFAISASTSGIVGAVFRANVRRVVDAAKRNDWPIVVATSLRSDYRLAAYTIGEPRAFLETRCADYILSSMYLDDAGVLHYHGGDAAVDYITEFPNYRPIAVYREGYPHYGYGRLQMTNFGRYSWLALQYDGCQSAIERVVITDMNTGRSSIFAVSDEEVWMGDPYINVCHVWSNGRSLYVLELHHEWDSTIPPNRGQPWSSKLWRFDISTNELTLIFVTKEPGGVYYGPDGALIAYSWHSRGLNRTCIIDGESGEILHTVENSTNAIIGKRWVVCVIKHPDRSFCIMLFDLENDWERYEIAIPKTRHYSSHSLSWAIALYEPDGD